MRDNQILSLRPQLNLSIQNSSEIEVFQNKTLRPILKLQHPITKMLLKKSNHFSKLILKVKEGDLKERIKLLDNFVSTNVVFKNRLIGTIIGMMSEKELSFYFDHESEINKRIISMQKERYLDND